MLYPCYAHLKTHRKILKKIIILIIFLGWLCSTRLSTSWKIPTRSAFEVMEDTSSLKIDPSPIPTLVKNRSYGSKHGCGT
jgi:hypothetical protein